MDEDLKKAIEAAVAAGAPRAEAEKRAKAVQLQRKGGERAPTTKRIFGEGGLMGLLGSLISPIESYGRMLGGAAIQAPAMAITGRQAEQLPSALRFLTTPQLERLGGKGDTFMERYAGGAEETA